MTRTVVAGACGLCLAFALAGCGGSSNESASTTTTTSTQSVQASRSAYANSLCGALATWKNSLTAVATTLKGGNLTKATLQSAATTVSDANKQLADAVKSLGAPSGAGGQQAKTALTTLSNELNTSADQIESAAKGATNTQSMLAAMGTASAALLQMSTDISTTITQLQNANVAQGWKQAFANSASCKSLNKS